MKLPRSKRKELRQQLAAAGVEKKSRRRVKRAVRAEVRESDHKTPKMTFNWQEGDLVRLPKYMGGHTVMIVEVYKTRDYFRYMDMESGQLKWLRGKEIRPA